MPSVTVIKKSNPFSTPKIEVTEVPIADVIKQPIINATSRNDILAMVEYQVKGQKDVDIEATAKSILSETGKAAFECSEETHQLLENLSSKPLFGVTGLLSKVVATKDINIICDTSGSMSYNGSGREYTDLTPKEKELFAHVSSKKRGMLNRAEELQIEVQKSLMAALCFDTNTDNIIKVTDFNRLSKPIQIKTTSSNGVSVSGNTIKIGKKASLQRTNYTITEFNKLFKTWTYNKETPILGTLNDIFKQTSKPTVHQFFTDGEPSDELASTFETVEGKSINGYRQIYKTLTERDKELNTVNFIKCSDDDDETGWLDKIDASKASAIDVIDDYTNERKQITQVQGTMFAYTEGLNVARRFFSSNDSDGLYDKLDEKKMSLEHLTSVTGIAHDNNEYEQFVKGAKADTQLAKLK